MKELSFEVVKKAAAELESSFVFKITPTCLKPEWKWGHNKEITINLLGKKKEKHALALGTWRSLEKA